MLFSSSNSFTWVDFLSYLPFVNYMTKRHKIFYRLESESSNLALDFQMRKQAYEKAGIWQRAHTMSEAQRKIEPKSADFKTVFFSLFFFNPRLLFINRKKNLLLYKRFSYSLWESHHSVENHCLFWIMTFLFHSWTLILQTSRHWSCQAITGAQNVYFKRQRPKKKSLCL